MLIFLAIWNKCSLSDLGKPCLSSTSEVVVVSNAYCVESSESRVLAREVLICSKQSAA